MRINDPVMPIRVKLSTPVIDERVVPNPPGEPTDLLSTVGINGTVYDIGEQSDWNEADNTSKAYIKNKPAIPAAQVQTDWNQNNTFAVDFIKNKPTKLSDFSNDEGFITNAVNSLLNYYLKSETYTQAEVNALIGAISTITFELVESLPTTDIQTNVIYLTPKNPAEPDNIYDEYINIDGTSEGWEKIGDTEIDLSNYYTKSETDTLLSSKVDKVDGKGLSENDFTDTLKDKLDGIEAEANKTVVDNVLDGTSANPVENRVVKSALDEKLNADETAVNSNGLVIATPVTDTVPYIYRQTPVKESFKALMHKIVGASVVWNQLGFKTGVSATAQYTPMFQQQGIDNTTDVINGHKYYLSFVQPSGCRVYRQDRANITVGWLLYEAPTQNTRRDIVGICTESGTGVSLNPIITKSGTTEEAYSLTNCMFVDLTTMFGTTIADYIYTLETSQSGSGIAWLQSYGFFTEDYYAYKQNKLESGCVSAHKTYDGETLLTNTELSPITLRGKLGLDNGELTVDGDIYNSDGSVTRNYEERAYQSGDESLTDAITDGTNTIVKLATPTTEQTTPFTEAELVGDTEEFIDYGVSQNTRDVAIPVGTETDYYQEMKLPPLPTTSGNHNLIYNPSTGFGWS